MVDVPLAATIMTMSAAMEASSTAFNCFTFAGFCDREECYAHASKARTKRPEREKKKQKRTNKIDERYEPFLFYYFSGYGHSGLLIHLLYPHD